MKVLVTGGAGYIGAIVAERLLADGHDVTVLDDLSTGHRGAVPGAARFVRASLLAPDGLADLVRDHDAVMHFAALSLVGASMEQPTHYVRSNVTAAANLLDAMEAAGVRRLVVSSTAAVYGAPTKIPIEERDPAAPTNPYGLSKLTVDRLVGFAARNGTAGVSLRYFNVAGATEERGEQHDPETHLIPNVLAVAAGRQDAVHVFGTEYPTPDGTAIRDYLHVADLADAHVLALQATTAPGHLVYNLGSSAGFSVRQVLDAARDVTGSPIPAVESERREGDPPVLVASSEKIRRELGWRPRKGTLDQILADAWRWTSRQSA